MNNERFGAPESLKNIRAEGGKVVGAGLVRDAAVGPIALRGEKAGRLLDLAITDPARLEVFAQHLLRGGDHLDRLMKSAQAVAQADEEIEALLALYLLGRFVHDAN